MKKNKHRGFNFTELFIVALIVSILAWYWLPIFLDSVILPSVILPIRKTLIAQGRFFQNHQKFSTVEQDLNINIPDYLKLERSSNALFVVYVPSEKTAYIDRPIIKAWRSHHIRSYIGAVFIQDKNKTIRIICALSKPTRDIPKRPSFKAGIASCSEGTFMIPETVNSLSEIVYPQ